MNLRALGAAIFAAGLAILAQRANAQPIFEVRPPQPVLLAHLAPFAVQYAKASVAVTAGREPTFDTKRALDKLLELALRFADAGDTATARVIGEQIAAIGDKAPTIPSDYESDPNDGRVRVAVGADAALAALADRLGDKAGAETHLARVANDAAPAPDDVYSDDYVEALSTMRDYAAQAARVRVWAAGTKGVRSAGAPKELLMRRAVWLAVGGDVAGALSLVEQAPPRSSLPLDVVGFTPSDARRTLALITKWAVLHGEDSFVRSLAPRALAVAAGPGANGSNSDPTVADDWGPALVASGDSEGALRLYDHELHGDLPFLPGQDGQPECSFYSEDVIALPAALRDDYRDATRKLYAALGKSYGPCVDPAAADSDAMDARLETMAWVAPRRLAGEIDKGSFSGAMSHFRTDSLEDLTPQQFASLVHDLDAGRFDTFDALAAKSDASLVLWAVNYAAGNYRPELRDMNLWPTAGFHSGL